MGFKVLRGREEEGQDGDGKMNPLCPYCKRESEMVTGKEIYPHRSDLSQKVFYSCKPCGAYVGCHPGTTKPLGRLADAELRRAKLEAHAVFDPMWQSEEMARSQAYDWLSNQMGIDMDECHIGKFDVEQCRQVVFICRKRMTQGG